MAPQDMHATLMAIAPPKPPAQDFLIEVLREDGEEEPSYARVVAAVRKMCKQSDDAPIAIGIVRRASQREPPRPRARWLVVGRAAGARLAPLQELREVPGVAVGVISFHFRIFLPASKKNSWVPSKIAQI